MSIPLDVPFERARWRLMLKSLAAGLAIGAVMVAVALSGGR